MLDGDRIDDEVLNDMGVPEVETPRTSLTPEDYAFSRQLHEAVERHGARILPWSHSAWARQFRLLRQSVREDIARIKEVLDWYCLHIGHDMVPHAQSASTFRAKYGNIEAARNRDQVRRPTVHVSKKAKQLADSLSRMIWPKGSEELLPSVVQLSLDAVVAFRHKLLRFCPANPVDKPNRLQRLASHVLNVTELADPIHLVSCWMEEVNGRLSRWAGWSGSLGGWAWNSERKEFRSQGRQWAEEFCGEPDMWDKLKEGTDAGGA